MRLGALTGVFAALPNTAQVRSYATSELIDINFYADFHLDAACCAGGQLQRANTSNLSAKVIK